MNQSTFGPAEELQPDLNDSTVCFMAEDNIFSRKEHPELSRIPVSPLMDEQAELIMPSPYAHSEHRRTLDDDLGGPYTQHPTSKTFYLVKQSVIKNSRSLMEAGGGGRNHSNKSLTEIHIATPV